MSEECLGHDTDIQFQTADVENASVTTHISPISQVCLDLV